MDMKLANEVTQFKCPKCGRVFQDWHSCRHHARGRKHANFCIYDKESLPTCLNAHSMLPAHSNSGHCDIRGRRRVIEDFHTIELLPDQQFYGKCLVEALLSTAYDDTFRSLTSWRSRIRYLRWTQRKPCFQICHIFPFPCNGFKT